MAEEENADVLDVPSTTLDQMVYGEKYPAPAFIKIDVEGGELDVLMGARAILLMQHPFVYCEVYEKWAESFGYTPGDLFHLMATVGYDGARAISKGEVKPLLVDEAVPAQLFDTSSDVLFFAASHSDLVAAFDKRFVR